MEIYHFVLLAKCFRLYEYIVNELLGLKILQLAVMICSSDVEQGGLHPLV